MLAVSLPDRRKGETGSFYDGGLSIITLTMVFGISRGKIRSEELSMIRENGTAASGVVESGTASQYASLKSLDYIKQTGRCFTVGAATAAEKDSGAESEKTTVCTIRWADRMHGMVCFVQPIQRFGEVIPKESLRSCFPKRR